LGLAFFCLNRGIERRTTFPAKRSQGRLSLKELRKLAGGGHHNAVGIAIRRFAERLEKDSALVQEPLSAGISMIPGLAYPADPAPNANAEAEQAIRAALANWTRAANH
jgi:ketosteroid isomerase-like protein